MGSSPRSIRRKGKRRQKRRRSRSPVRRRHRTRSPSRYQMAGLSPVTPRSRKRRSSRRDASARGTTAERSPCSSTGRTADPAASSEKASGDNNNSDEETAASPCSVSPCSPGDQDSEEVQAEALAVLPLDDSMIPADEAEMVQDESTHMNIALDDEVQLVGAMDRDATPICLLSPSATSEASSPQQGDTNVEHPNTREGEQLFLSDIEDLLDTAPTSGDQEVSLLNKEAEAGIAELPPKFEALWPAPCGEVAALLGELQAEASLLDPRDYWLGTARGWDVFALREDVVLQRQEKAMKYPSLSALHPTNGSCQVDASSKKMSRISMPNCVGNDPACDDDAPASCGQDTSLGDCSLPAEDFVAPNVNESLGIQDEELAWYTAASQALANDDVDEEEYCDEEDAMALVAADVLQDIHHAAQNDGTIIGDELMEELEGIVSTLEEQISDYAAVDPYMG